MRRLGRLIPLLGALLLLAPVAEAAPLTYPVVVEDGFPNPGTGDLSSLTWILYDETLDLVLSEQGADVVRPMASTTKIMTALVAMENSDPTDMVTVPESATTVIGSEIGLVAGERVEMGLLLRALMIRSANDAAAAIAEHVAGSVPGFVALMNARADELGLANTNFVNPHGVDEPGHESTARDLLTLARHAMTVPGFADLVRARRLVFTDAPDGTARGGENTNKLLFRYEGALGVKTGQTPRARHVFVAAAERGGRRVYAVVMGSAELAGHLVDSEELFDYAFRTLGVFTAAYSEQPYRASLRPADPAPMVAQHDMETYLLLSTQGLYLETPTPQTEVPTQPEEPATETVRHPDRGPSDLLSSLSWWFRSLLGNG